jgi:hypothetical protein
MGVESLCKHGAISSYFIYSSPEGLSVKSVTFLDFSAPASVIPSASPNNLDKNGASQYIHRGL